MRINHNIASLNTYRQLTSNTGATSKSLEKLSSGLRINRAGDDAAGLAISEKMRGQIRGLDQASRNSQDAISLIQTAEGGLNETHSILQRMRELAVQSSNDTNNDNDRAEIQKEIVQLKTEVDRIASTTEFNTKKLLNGSANIGTSFTLGSVADQAKLTNITGTGDTVIGNSLALTAATTATADTQATNSTGFFTAGTVAFTGTSQIIVNGTQFTFDTSNTVQQAIDTINNAKVGVTVSLSANELSFVSDTKGSAANMSVTVGTTAGDFGAMAAISQGIDATITTAATPAYSAVGNRVTIQAGALKGLSFDVTANLVAATTIAVDSNGTLNMQIGANEKQQINLGISDMRSAALGITGVDVSTQIGASSAITVVQKAIDTVSSERSKLGAYQNRLEHTINNLNTSSENLTASESRIRDVDMAKEMMEFTKNNILSQAAQAMLAQANQQPQGVLQLLR